ARATHGVLPEQHPCRWRPAGLSCRSLEDVPWLPCHAGAGCELLGGVELCACTVLAAVPGADGALACPVACLSAVPAAQHQLARGAPGLSGRSEICLSGHVAFLPARPGIRAGHSRAGG